MQAGVAEYSVCSGWEIELRRRDSYLIGRWENQLLTVSTSIKAGQTRVSIQFKIQDSPTKNQKMNLRFLAVVLFAAITVASAMPKPGIPNGCTR